MNMKQFRPLRVNKCRSANENHGTFSCYGRERHGDVYKRQLEEIGLERVGAPGTTAALAMLNDQVKKGGVMASSYVGGLSGAFIPVSEDQGMIDAVSMGALTIEKLEAMTCVCSVAVSYTHLDVYKRQSRYTSQYLCHS